MTINRKTVQRQMREMGLAAIYPGPNLSKRAQQHAVFPYLLRGVAITRPNQVWGIDLTYIRLRGGWMYLVAVLDWFSRYVVSWELDQTLEMPFVLRAVERALTEATPEIWNSDQGSHFTSPQYIDRLQAAGTQISMDGRGRARSEERRVGKECRSRQHLHRAAAQSRRLDEVAHCEIRGGLSARLRQPTRSTAESNLLLSLLLCGASASITQLSHPGAGVLRGAHAAELTPISLWICGQLKLRQLTTNPQHYDDDYYPRLTKGKCTLRQAQFVS